MLKTKGLNKPIVENSSNEKVVFPQLRVGNCMTNIKMSIAQPHSACIINLNVRGLIFPTPHKKKKKKTNCVTNNYLKHLRPIW